jgi:hypothetical protein
MVNYYSEHKVRCIELSLRAKTHRGAPCVYPSQGLPDFMGRDKWCTTKITLYFKVSLNRLFAVEATFKCNPDEVHYKPLPYEGRI